MKRFILIPLLLLVGCGPSSDSNSLNADNQAASSSNESLFVASGSCYAGGVATSAGAATVAAFDPTTGRLIRVVVDYSSFSPGDMPVSIEQYDANHLLVAVENASGRRIDLVSKDGSSISTYLTNSAALSGVLHAFVRATDGSLLLSKTTAIEKFSSSKIRILQGVNPFINAPASTCATVTTMITGIATTTNGKILFAHSAATPNNKIDMISSTGYAATSDCLSTQAAPTTLAMPTAILAHSSGKVLVAYASTTAASNSIYSYDLNTTTNAFSNAVSAYGDYSIVNGPTAMAEDTVTKNVYIAVGNSSANTIEKFTLNSATSQLTRVGSSPFLPSSVYTRCVVGMKVLSN